MGIDRRQFCEGLGGSTALLFLAACGGGGYGMTTAPTPAPSPGSCGASASMITGNHGHVLVVPMADLNSTSPISYNIQGSADHNHTVTLDPSQLALIKAKMAVMLTSSSGSSTYFAAHVHGVTANCT